MSALVLPEYLKQYFWGDDLTQLDWDKQKQYLLQTLLDLGDERAVHWMFTRATQKEIIDALKNGRLKKRSANFWAQYFHIPFKEIRCLSLDYLSQQPPSWKN